MHEQRLLHELLVEGGAGMHGRRRAALMRAVGAVLRGERLTLTDVGRNLEGRAYEKHKVKRVDRLLGNAWLHGERLELYAAIAGSVTEARGWVPVVVDWTAGPAQRYLMLEAAVPVGGRAVAVYQEVHALAAYKNARVQKRFVQRLCEVLPSGRKVVVIADAGVQRSFFEEVEKQGWYWVWRLSEPLSVRKVGAADWQPLPQLHAQAAGRPRELGEYELRKSRPHAARLCVLRPPKRYRRERPNHREHGHGTMQRRYRKLYRGPWVLASNLPREQFSASDIAELYARRMQIEETFRDLKSHRFGYALDYARSRQLKRVENLRLIGALAMLVQCLVGLAGYARRLTRHFQVNTERRRRVLSWAFLARRLLRSVRFTLSMQELREILALLPTLTTYEPVHT